MADAIEIEVGNRDRIFITPEMLASLGFSANEAGPWVAFNYAQGDGYSNFAEPGPVFIFGAGQSRNNGDYVELAGTIAVPVGGTAHPSIITQLPADQCPQKVRTVPCVNGSGDAFALIIDDKLGTFTTKPGAILVGSNQPADTFLALDGLSFLRT